MFGGAKSWSERAVAVKPCRECAAVFQPTCGGNMYCRPCAVVVKRRNHSAGARTWRAKNPLRHARTRANFDLKQFGLTLDDYISMVEAQNGQCAICATSTPGGRGKTRPFALDHCHSTGRVRGLLCSACNTALGLFRDNPAVLRRAADYIERIK